MRYLPFFLFFSLKLTAQFSLSRSRHTSTFTYVYKLSVHEAKELYHSKLDEVDDKYLQHLQDSLIDRTDLCRIPQGNYLFLWTYENKLHYELREIGDLELYPISNHYNLLLQLKRKDGSPVNDALVQLKKRKLEFNKDLQAYELGKYTKKTFLGIESNGVYYHRLVEAPQKPRKYYYSRNKWISSSPLKYLINPARKIAQPFNRYAQLRWKGNYDFYERPLPREWKYKGYMTSNKPRYKPGDTLKMKAFLYDRYNNPIKSTLLLRLFNSSGDLDTVLTQLNPYRAGAYEYSFVLTKELAGRLDEDLQLSLEQKGSLRFDRTHYDRYKGDLDEGGFFARRKVVKRMDFKFEEYELGSIQFKARSENDVHHRGKNAILYFKATDDNGMAVLDGRVQVIVKPNSSTITSSEAKLFIADTLWNFTLPLEAVGETKLVLPDSIFPKANFHYEVFCNFLNSNNEAKSQYLYHQFENNEYQLQVRENKDSLWISQEQGKQSIETTTEITLYSSQSDSIRTIKTTLPLQLRMYQNVSSYKIKTPYSETTYRSKNISGKLNANAQRTADSVFIVVDNPSKYYFHYSLFSGQHLIRQGYGQELNYFEKTSTPKPYFLSLQYISGAQVMNEDYTITYNKNSLEILVKQPETVYPGQQVEVELTVTKKDGSPASGADVTAYAHTAKFEESHLPPIPYFGKKYKQRTNKSLAVIRPNSLLIQDSIGMYNWKRWSHELGLDTMAYYQFTHPESISKVEEPTPDSSTQFAPFALLGGDILSIKQLYLDEVPIYFNQARHLKRYSFMVSPGKHAIRFRMANAMVEIDSLWMTAGKKNFFAINLDTSSNKQVKYTKMPDTLTAYEANYWNRYMLLIENNFGEKLSYLRQYSSLYPLTEVLQKKQPYYYNSNQPILTGPFPNSYSELVVKDKYTRGFDPEGGYSYLLTKDLVRQKQLPLRTYPFSTRLNWDGIEVEKNFGEFVMTEKQLDSLWQDYLDRRNASEDLFRNPSLTSKGNGELAVTYAETNQSTTNFPKNQLVFRYDDPDFLRVYSGSSRQLGYYQPGLYRIYVLYNNNRYVLIDSIEVKPNGRNQYLFSELALKKVDSSSEKMMQIVNNRMSSRNFNWYYNNSEKDLLELKTRFNETNLTTSQLTRTVSGIVKDSQKGQPLVGVTVQLKGTRVATVTDQNGRFQLNVSPQGSIVCSYIGYETYETRLGEEDYLEVKMAAANMKLEEVVVVGYGARSKKEFTGSVASVSAKELLGKMPGVQIRGNSTLTLETPPLMIVDGLPYSGPALSPDSIAEVSVLKDAAAVSLYGARAANGVIIISTKKKAAAALQELTEMPPLGAASMRQHFRDDAYWQPKLRTDANGKASYRFTYPDDITNWKHYFLAMGPGKFSGATEMSVRSFKQISTNLSTPPFLVEGDRAQLIAKALNYSLDTIRVKTSFSWGDAPMVSQELSLSNSHIDSFWVTAPSADSLSFSYALQKADGYSDGELRKIPVMKQGVKETSGFFTVLDRDTSFTLAADPSKSDLKIYASATVLPVLMDEVDKIRDYSYYCNEQLASKLKALLLKRRVMQMQQKEFKEKKSIQEIITRLLNAKNSASLWGWWPGNEYQPWISLHVVEALLMAKSDSFAVNWNAAQVVDELVYRMEKQYPADQLLSLQLLHQLKAKVDFGKYTDSLSNKKLTTQYDQWRLLYLKQQLGIPATLDSLLKYKQTSLFGNNYWGSDRYYFFDNSVQETILAYKILKQIGSQEEVLKKIRYWFLEQRKSGQWRNTYESSLILETILPDLMKDQSNGPSELYINSKRTEKFPLALSFGKAENVSVQSKGGQPIYFTAYQQGWNPKPQAVKGSFEVMTVLEQEGKEVKALKAGLPAQLKVKVKVLADAEYVMVEVPIPAGCSYKDKPKGYAFGEVYREYYKEKVSLFCSRISKGEAEFVINLLPRYSGNFYLNPALVEQMYFPVFYGREGLKSVEIK